MAAPIGSLKAKSEKLAGAGGRKPKDDCGRSRLYLFCHRPTMI